MEKKEMRWYESPKMNLVNVELQGMLCLSPGGDGHPGGGSDFSDEDEE